MSRAMRPFWRYYGGKWRATPRYPAPEHDLVIEPFAGAAGYSTRHAHPRVLLIDRSEAVIGAWQYLIRTSADEIRALPSLEPGQSVDDLNMCQEARWLIGWWCNDGAASPCKTPSKWSMRPENCGWAHGARERIASQVDRIRGWRAIVGTYRDAPDIEATWFIDPPYIGRAGSYYPHGSGAIDYSDLAEWCQSLRGLVIVCENAGAEWLPFESIGAIQATPGKGRSGVSHEAAWIRRTDGLAR